MTDEQRLSDALHQIVPTPPERPERAPAVEERVRRHRRRTGVATVLVAAAVVAAAVAVPVTLSRGDGPGTDAEPAATPEISCPATPDEEPSGPGTLPGGATAVRLCSGPGVPFDAPDDALTTGVEDLVDLVNAQPERDGQPMCTMDLGRDYALVFGYPDGTTRTVTGQLYGCHDLQVGSVTRTNPEAPFELFVRSLRDQRAALEPPADAASTPVCGTDDTMGDGSPVARPEEMVVGTLCVLHESKGADEVVPVEVPEEDLALLLTDGHVSGGGFPGGPTLVLVGKSAWGDVTSRLLSAGWTPGPEAQAVLDDLIAQTEPPAPRLDAGSSAAEVVAAYVDLLNRGDRAEASALWQSQVPVRLPAGYLRVDWFLLDVRPLPRISAWRDATAVVGVYREVVRDASPPTREATFTLGRDENGAFRIVGVDVGEVIRTGR